MAAGSRKRKRNRNTKVGSDFVITSHYDFLRMQKFDRMGIIPKWANLQKIQDIYDLCKKMNKAYYKENNIPRHTKTRPRKAAFHVDHIIPIKGKNVCGLHVANNLRIIGAYDNMSKGNRLLPEDLI